MDAEWAYLCVGAVGSALLGLVYAAKSIKGTLRQRRNIVNQQKQLNEARVVTNVNDLNKVGDGKIVLYDINAKAYNRTLCLMNVQNFQKIGMTKAIGTKIYGNQNIDIKCDETWIHNSLVTVKQSYDSPNNIWYDICSLFGRQNSPGMATVQISASLTGITLYGTIHLQDNKCIIDTEYIGRSIGALKQYFQECLFENSWKIVTRVAIFSCLLFTIYKLVKSIGQIPRNHQNDSVFGKQCIETDPNNRLDCVVCKTRPSDCLMDCCHLCICQECINITTECPICNKTMKYFVKIFMA